MPQLDKLTVISNVFWFSLCFLLYYRYVSKVKKAETVKCETVLQPQTYLRPAVYVGSANGRLANPTSLVKVCFTPIGSSCDVPSTRLRLGSSSTSH